MQTLLPWLVMMVTAPHGLVSISEQSLSAAANDVSSRHGSDGDHLLNTYAGQQFPRLVDRSETKQDTRHLHEGQGDSQSDPRKRETPPLFRCHQDSQERVVCLQKVADLGHTHPQDVHQQRALVDPREDDVHQESYHKRVVRQDEAYRQDGHQQDGHSAGAQQDPLQSAGAQQDPLQSAGAQQDPPQSNGSQQQNPPQSNGAQQDPRQSNGAQAEYPPCVDTRCSCAAVSWSVSVDCSNSGLDEVPATVHPNTTWLSLSGNNLQQIGNDSLAGLSRATLVYLGNGSISEVHEDAFAGMRNLRAVDLSSNRLSTLPRAAFRSSGKLQKLDLSGNPLRLAGGRLLESASLYWLNLSHCGLSHLPEHSFKGVPQLVMLDLSENQLVVPTALALESLTGLQRLPLVGNPVSCCEVSELRAWVDTRQLPVIRREQVVGPLPTCASPASLYGRPWTAATGHAACSGGLDVAAAVGCGLLGLVVAALLVVGALWLLRRRRRAARRRRTHSMLQRQQSQPAAGDAGMYEPPPVAPKYPGWAGQLGWDAHAHDSARRPSAPRYVAAFKALPPPPQPQPQSAPPTVYDDAVGAGRRRQDTPVSSTYDDAVGAGRTSALYDYIVALDRQSLGAGERPPHHSSVPSVLEGCDYYEDA